jgi:hypothetical protein
MYFLTVDLRVFNSFNLMWGLSTVPVSVLIMQQKSIPLVMMALLDVLTSINLSLIR